MSRPSMSVPNQYNAEGSRVRREVLSVVGSTVQRYGASTAISTITISNAAPIAIVGWRRRNPVTPRSGLTGGHRSGSGGAAAMLSAGTAMAGGGLNSGSSDRARYRGGRSPD